MMSHSLTKVVHPLLPILKYSAAGMTRMRSMTGKQRAHSPVAMLTSMMENGVTSDEYPIRTTGDVKSLCGDCAMIKRLRTLDFEQTRI